MDSIYFPYYEDLCFSSKTFSKNAFCTWEFLDLAQHKRSAVTYSGLQSNFFFFFPPSFSSPKQTDMRHKTKRQQVHTKDVNPSNETPITSNSTHPNSH